MFDTNEKSLIWTAILGLQAKIKEEARLYKGSPELTELKKKYAFCETILHKLNKHG